MSPATASSKSAPTKPTPEHQNAILTLKPYEVALKAALHEAFSLSYRTEALEQPDNDDDDWMNTIEFAVPAPTYTASPRSPSPIETEFIDDL